MQDEDVASSILNSEWPKDAGSSEFIRKLRAHIQSDILWAHLYFPDDITRRANWLLQHFPVEKDYLDCIVNVDDEHALKPYLIAYDLDHELDLSKLATDDSRYWIDLGGYGRYSRRPIMDHFAKIHLKDADGCWHEYSLPIYRDRYLHTLSRETFSSHDLVDQLLVLAVVKGAQAGHRKCREKLIELFQPAARSIAHRFVNKWLKEMDMKPSEAGALAKENIDSVADSILLMLIQGDPLRTLMESLKEKQDVSLQLNRQLQKMLVEQITKLPQQLLIFEVSAEKLKNRTLSDSKRLKKELSGYSEAAQAKAWSAMLPFMRDFILQAKNGSFEEIVENNQLDDESAKAAKAISDWFARDRMRDHEKGAIIQYLTTLLNPFIMLTTHPSFNSVLYRPNKKTPFPVWLFGDTDAKDLGKQGAFQRKLNDWFKSLCHHRKDKNTGKIVRRLRPEHYAGGVAKYNDNLIGVNHPLLTGDQLKSTFLAPDVVSAIVKLVRRLRQENKISNRDGQIVLFYYLRGNYRKGLKMKITKKALGRQYGLSERQIGRILANFRNLIKPS